MRELADAARVRAFARELGCAAPIRARLYLTGGATAVLENWRPTTIDIDDFDPYSQALSKIERGFGQDLADVEQMLDRRMVDAPLLRELFAAIEPVLFRYPAIEPAVLRRKLDEALARR